MNRDEHRFSALREHRINKDTCMVWNVFTSVEWTANFWLLHPYTVSTSRIYIPPSYALFDSIESDYDSILIISFVVHFSAKRKPIFQWWHSLSGYALNLTRNKQLFECEFVVVTVLTVSSHHQSFTQLFFFILWSN